MTVMNHPGQPETKDKGDIIDGKGRGQPRGKKYRYSSPASIPFLKIELYGAKKLKSITIKVLNILPRRYICETIHMEIT
jgi:hypothetical protein